MSGFYSVRDQRNRLHIEPRPDPLLEERVSLFSRIMDSGVFRKTLLSTGVIMSLVAVDQLTGEGGTDCEPAATVFLGDEVIGEVVESTIGEGADVQLSVEATVAENNLEGWPSDRDGQEIVIYQCGGTLPEEGTVNTQGR